MIGLNQDEGAFPLVCGAPGFNITSESLITRNEFLAGVGLTIPNASDITKEAIIFHYTDWTAENNKMKNHDSLGSLAGNRLFICPVLRFAHR